MTYQIFKEINGAFQDTGETQPDLSAAQARIAVLSAGGGSYSANESTALAELYALADSQGVPRNSLFNPVAGAVPNPGEFLSGMVYDTRGRATSCVIGVTTYTIAYPDSTHVTISGGGKLVTITLDSAGRVIGKAVV